VRVLKRVLFLWEGKFNVKLDSEIRGLNEPSVREEIELIDFMFSNENKEWLQCLRHCFVGLPWSGDDIDMAELGEKSKRPLKENGKINEAKNISQLHLSVTSTLLKTIVRTSRLTKANGEKES
jgi:hypothetical protein